MKINNVHLITSAVNSSHYPEHDLPEILLLGRSNVGKSSFINAIINRKALARTSSSPGKTRTVNFYNVEDTFCFVDMPGYGYAKVSKEERRSFRKMIEEYIKKRDNLVMVVQLVDFRHKPTEDDVAVTQWLMLEEIYPLVVATKVDKVKRSEHNKNIKVLMQTMGIEDRDEVILFSSETKSGKLQVEMIIDDVLREAAEDIEAEMPLDE